MRSSRAVVLALLLSLVGAACGARLSNEQRAAGIGDTISAGREGGVGNGATGGTGGPGTSGTGGSGRRSGGNGVTGAGAVGGTAGSGGTGGTGTNGTGGNTGTGGTGGNTASGDNGGATDVGVTGDRIVIASLADISGPRPGLFKSAHQAVAAFSAYINSQGGIHGRAVVPRLIDSKTDSAAYRAGVLEACDDAFAIVGSMSAFDDTAKQALESCMIPDLPAPPTAQSHIEAATTYPPFPNRGDMVSTGPPAYIKQKFGNAVIKKAAILWVNAAAGQSNSRARKAAWEKEGFDFVVDRPVQVVEPNLTPFIQEMEDKGVQYVTFVGDNDTIARLMKTADQQDWAPKVWDWDSVAYDPKFPQKVGPAGEGAYIFTNTQLWDESASNPEMALYLQWLNRVAPGADPDYFGLYAWSAARLFADTALKVGPRITRTKLLDALRKTAQWDGRGIHGPHQTAKKIPTRCFVYVKLRGGAFKREHPARGMECGLGSLQQV